MVEHPKLYTRDVSGAVRVWWIQQDGARYRSRSGQVGGIMTSSGWTEAEPKNVGRSNETSAVEQADLEIAAEYQKKLDRKYYKTQVEAGCANFGGHRFFAPMLAQKFDKVNPDGILFSQPKLDGYRCIASGDTLSSRQGKIFNVIPVRDALRPIFDQYPDLILDGELYNHDYHDNFNEIGSLIKNSNKDQSLVQYHIYDVPSIDDQFSARREALKDLRTLIGDDHPNLRVVPTHLIRSPEQMDELFGAYLAAGYEGQMVRQDAPYEIGKRSKFLLKRKQFVDDEFPISRIYEGKGNWAGYAKGVEIIAPNDARCEDGERPCAGIRGDRAFCRSLLENPTQYTHVTVRFLGYTPGGVPRCPVAVAWHAGEREL